MRKLIEKQKCGIRPSGRFFASDSMNCAEVLEGVRRCLTGRVTLVHLENMNKICPLIQMIHSRKMYRTYKKTSLTFRMKKQRVFNNETDLSSQIEEVLRKCMFEKFLPIYIRKCREKRPVPLHFVFSAIIYTNCIKIQQFN